MSSRATVASKITYDVLAVDSGEDTADESPSEGEESPSTQEPLKPTKSAIKKAARLARLERKQQEKLAKAAARQAAKAGPSKAPPSGLPQPTSVAHVESETPVSAPTEPTKVVAPVTAPKAPAPAPVADVVSSTKTATIVPPSDLASSVKPVTITVKETPPPKVDVAPSPRVDVVKPKPEGQPLPLSSIKSDVVTNGSSAPKPAPAPTPQDAEKVKKRQNALTRTLWTFIMIFGFIGLLTLGHAYMVILVLLCQTLVYREVTALFSLKTAPKESHDSRQIKSKDPWSKTLNWYFFAVTNYFLYGESIIYYFKHVVFADAQLTPFATNHRMISFMLYIIGFMGFVMSLKKGYLKQQFGLFCWVHMTLLLIVVSSHFIVNNILEGLIWFWVPASLVICNDCFAYIWGVTLGRTPLISLSPKKTVEGFVGAFVCTVIFAVLWGSYFMRFDYMICPVQDLGVSAWSSTPCQPNPVFVWRSVALWQPLSVLIQTLTGQTVKTISYCPYQLHLLVLACFASLVAPFGGFFASGFKRAFDIKDFGDSIPGHGGMTDRMDCQFLMGIFTYVYYSSLIRTHNVTVGGLLQTIVSSLTTEQQIELIHDLQRYLAKQGITVS